MRYHPEQEFDHGFSFKKSMAERLGVFHIAIPQMVEKKRDACASLFF
jgi:hypothetical protein